MSDSDKPEDPGRGNDTGLPRAFTPICAIGASAGGVTALQQLFRLLPTDLGLAYVVIVHLAPDHPSALDQILSACTTMPVHQVQDGPVLHANCIYVIAPDRELVIDGDHVSARDFAEPRGRRAPIDMFFRSVASARGDGIAVILTGAGSDGALGVRAIKEAGGVVMIQEPAEAAFPMMPQNAIATGTADFIGTLPRLAERIAEVAQSKEAVRSLDADGAANDLRRIIGFLRTRTGHDFSSYKRATVMRRVTRRMQVTRTDSLADYGDLLRSTPEEARELFADLLISVTMFFRDRGAFQTLEQRAIGQIFDAADEEEGIRVWVVGCATGEEAYSIAMLLLEEAERRRVATPIQIFASDLDEGALATAREGRYPRSIEADVSEERLGRFFLDEGTHFRIRKEVRDLLLFATHSVLKDPPFTRLHLVTCRNLLIYLERTLQQQVCSIFHYGLRDGGFLFLGSAETAEGMSDQYVSVDREARLYRAKPRSGQTLPILPAVPLMERVSTPMRPNLPTRGDAVALSTAHFAALEKIAPPSALIDGDGNVLNLSASAGRFIQHTGGPLSSSLGSIIRPELRMELETAVARAAAQIPTLTHPTPVRFDGETRQIALHVQPVIDDRSAPRTLVFFLDNGAVEKSPQAIDKAKPDEVRRLHAKLAAAQEALIVSRHEHEVSAQDLRAANEELQSINEEYRSTAEELETSKEELQSINEELQTVNAELKIKLEGISVAHSDLRNITASTEIGTLFLDTELRIRLFTPPIADLINITDADQGRAITNFTHRLDYDKLARDARQVLRTLSPLDREVPTHDGRWFVVRIRPYRTIEDRINGVVLTFIDVTELHAAEARLGESERELRALVEVSFQVLYRMSPDWREMRYLAGGGFLADTRSPTATWLDQYIPGEDQSQVRAAIDSAIANKAIFDLEHRVLRDDGTIGWTHSRALPLLDPDTGAIAEWLGSAADVTARHEAEQALAASEERYRLIVESVPQFVWTARNEGDWTWTNSQWSAFTGQTERESRGWGWLRMVHPDDRDAVMRSWNAAMEGGRFEAVFRVAASGETNYHWFRTRAIRSTQPNVGGPIWFGTSIDVDDLRQLQDQQSLLVAELQHRVRNILTVVRSVFARTVEVAGDPEEMADHFKGRLDALARTQVIVTQSASRTADLQNLIRDELLSVGTNDGKNVRIAGPDVALPATVAETLGLAIHELTTNALKYGALKIAGAKLDIRWHVTSEFGSPMLHLTWTETGVPAVPVQPKREGFGRELIENALPYRLKAETMLEFGRGGVRCSISLPLPQKSDDDLDSQGADET